MKIARFMPIYKNKNKNESRNYITIFILSQISKIVEKIFYKRLKKYIEIFTLLYDNQYGSRERYSTVIALSDLVDNIVTATDKKLHTKSVFFYLEKVIDTIDHSLLMKKARALRHRRKCKSLVIKLSCRNKTVFGNKKN